MSNITSDLRELDRRVAAGLGDEKGDDPRYPDEWTSPDGTHYWTQDGGPRPYSTAIEAAERCIAHLEAQGWLWDMGSVLLDEEPGYRFNFFRMDDEFPRRGFGRTRAETICRAFLEVRNEEAIYSKAKADV
jgi:hypothetical protein